MSNYIINTDISSEKLSSASLNSCTLLLLISHKKLRYAIRENSTGNILALKNFTFGPPKEGKSPLSELTNIIRTENLVTSGYASVKAGIFNNKSTLIPKALFNEDSVRPLLEYNTYLDRDDRVFHEYIEPIDSYNLFAVEETTQNTLSAFFPGIKYCHSSTGLIKQVLKEYQREEQDVLFVNVIDRFIEAVVIKGGKFTLFNRYQFRTTKDFIYFLLLICDELDLDQRKVQVVFAGDIERDAATYEITRKYIANISFSGRPGDIELDTEFSSIPYHRYYGLYSLQQCG